jgi:hypothetical protein
VLSIFLSLSLAGRLSVGLCTARTYLPYLPYIQHIGYIR